MSDEVQITSKVFQGHFTDAQFHLEQSGLFHSVVKNSVVTDPKQADQVALAKSRAHGRAAFISIVAGCESLCNCIEQQFAKRKSDNLPTDWVSKKVRERLFRDWSISTKIRFLPVLCCNESNPPSSYFQSYLQQLREFDEIVKIRNSLIHGAYVETRYKIVFGDGNFHTISDFQENFWPITRIARDPRSLTYDEVNIAYTKVMAVMAEAIRQVGSGIDERFLRDEVAIYGTQRLTLRREAISNDSAPKWVRILLGIS
jgi:hypothetical protein